MKAPIRTLHNGEVDAPLPRPGRVAEIKAEQIGVGIYRDVVHGMFLFTAEAVRRYGGVDDLLLAAVGAEHGIKD